MVRVPGGSFAMGSERFYDEEASLRRVRVDPFWMDAAHGREAPEGAVALTRPGRCTRTSPREPLLVCQIGAVRRVCPGDHTLPAVVT
ncbi:SUMF1/EgtB/PvdO family nonheme iron enzyme [Sphingomonas aracearum]|uniref:Sulfatase-modifying factor enzyme-like domain-containing protein n=1 Tax=Sphingomonas aracearum TaxID=2283317 RepID=A0A369VUJ7_9SPHN|nr:hypothetical protein DVW87_12835 [Sphingomonas aracearum]